ncbi:DUF4163 domain-containing protein [Sphingomonas sp. G124]|uniref:DUF4163 domain-containing protein n=1 Tax=Sphingomonas cremea TaxID=2904799 RepID=A0A9X1QLQ8_9SPHN|nr:DUF4163 domain-containing protein [Sphingomonas cremea]MCF2513694.1 DUF4163 domain-containing protein [Sphingomonas cremea]
MKHVLPLLVLLSSCGQQPAPSPSNQAADAAPATRPAAPAAKAFVHDEKNDLIEFHYGWSAEAAAVPQLVDRFSRDMNKVRAELIAGAKEDKALREKEGFEFHGYSSTTDYTTAGQSARLLSLSVDAAAYTGGAHGNYGTNGLLWDRQAVKEIKVADLFAEPTNMDRLLTQRWCDALNKAREEKRGESVGGDGMFDDCPKLEDIAIVPTDMDGNGRFDRLTLTASPYVAGPYVEGSYEIELAATPDLIAALKAEYRDSFEAGQPQ